MPQELVINTNQVIEDLDKNPVTVKDAKGKDVILTLGRGLALCLVAGKAAADPLRSYTLAQKIMAAHTGIPTEVPDNTREIKLDASEVQYIQEAVIGFDGFHNLIKGQLLFLLQ